MLKYGYLDLDSVAYIGACIAQKLNYKWVNKITKDETEVFKSAKESKVWHTGAISFGEIQEEEWERVTITNLLSEEEAIQATEKELQVWISTAKYLSKNPDIKLKGYLTSSGVKTKDIGGLEDRYQCNRYKDKENWVPIDRPVHLKACREYIIQNYDWVSMSPKGYEADALVVCLAEKRGKWNGMIMSKDKDLKQAMDVVFVDMNLPWGKRVQQMTTKIGHLNLVKKNGVNKLEGDGFKFLCAQTIMGDSSDGYYGVKGAGGVLVYNLLNDLHTVESLCEALVTFYKEKFPNGHQYTSWDKKPQERTAEELLIQHCQLAYHERGLNDKSNPLERYLNGEEPIKRYK